MGNTSTFGTFTMARLGIYVAQHALTVTGNNISNINTKGYVREQLDQSSMYFGGADRYFSRFDIRENGGVLATGIGQMRDMYLDIRYRNEMTRVGESDMKVDGLRQLDNILDEVAKGNDGEGVLEARFNDFIQQLEEMLKDENAGSDDIDSLVRASAEGLAIQFNKYADKLSTLMENETAKLKEELSATNTILTKIRDLNETIRKTQIFGGTGLTLKDERNLLIDDLSKQIGINVIYETESLGDGSEVEKLRITTSGEPTRTLIDGIYGSQLSIVQEEKEFPKLDDAGNPVLDKEGKPVMEKRFVDCDNFDLAISELVDSRGKPDPAEPNKLKQYATVERLLTDKTAANYKQADEWAKVKDNIKTLTFASEAEAQAFEDALNEQFGYSKLSGDPKQRTADDVPYFHVSRDEFGKTGTKYVVHLHDTNSTADVDDGNGGTVPAWQTNYSYANVDAARITRLTDTELRGGLQAIREMLTESGEYSTADRESLKLSEDETDNLHYDPDAGTKRGIPYYMKALDNLANTFANIINDANTLYGNSYIESLEQNAPETIYMTNEQGKFVDKTGAVTDDPSKRVLKDEYKKYYRQNGVGLFLGADGKVLDPQDDPTKYIPNDRIIDEKTLFKQNENGEFVDANGNTLALEKVIDKVEAVDKQENASEFDASDIDAYVEKFNNDPAYNTDPAGKKYTYAKTDDNKIKRTSADGTVKYLSLTTHDGGVLDKTKLVLKDEYQKYFQQNTDGTFKRDDDGYLKLTDEYKKFSGGPLFTNSGNTNDASNITAANISVASDWALGQNHILRSKSDRADVESRQQDNIRHMITLMKEKHDFTNEETGSKFNLTFQEMLTQNIAGTLAKDENITTTMLSNYNTTADEIYVDRDAVMGVDLNDEAMNMMQFQKAYSAACRLMTTYDEMLEKLINGTAI